MARRLDRPCSAHGLVSAFAPRAAATYPLGRRDCFGSCESRIHETCDKFLSGADRLIDDNQKPALRFRHRCYGPPPTPRMAVNWVNRHEIPRSAGTLKQGVVQQICGGNARGDNCGSYGPNLSLRQSNWRLLAHLPHRNRCSPDLGANRISARSAEHDPQSREWRRYCHFVLRVDLGHTVETQGVLITGNLSSPGRSRRIASTLIIS